MKKMIAIGGVLAGLFFAGAWMQSRESQLKGAVYSSPVTVVNTSANPGSMLEAEKASRIPYVSTVSQSCTSGGQSACVFTFTAAPAGYRLMVETLGSTIAATTNAGVVATLESKANAVISVSTNVFTPLVGQLGYAGFAQNVNMVFDPPDGQPLVLVNANYTNAAPFPEVVTLTGYLQNCSVSPCPAVQH